MKKIILLSVISLGIFALAGCGNRAEKANTEAPKNANTDAPKNANTVANQNKEPAKSVFKPVEISPDAVKVNEFIDKVGASLNTWKGKEVTVTGYVSATSGKVGVVGYALTLKNDEMANSVGMTLGCYVKEEALPEGMMGKTVEVKGIVIGMDSDSRGKTVYLDPCKLKQ